MKIFSKGRVLVVVFLFLVVVLVSVPKLFADFLAQDVLKTETFLGGDVKIIVSTVCIGCSADESALPGYAVEGNSIRISLNAKPCRGSCATLMHPKLWLTITGLVPGKYKVYFSKQGIEDITIL